MAQQFNPTRVSATRPDSPNRFARARDESKAFQRERILVALFGQRASEFSRAISGTYRCHWPAPRAHKPAGIGASLSAGQKNAFIVGGMQLSGLFVYPIKACAGIALERAAVVT